MLPNPTQVDYEQAKLWGQPLRRYDDGGFSYVWKPSTEYRTLAIDTKTDDRDSQIVTVAVGMTRRVAAKMAGLLFLSPTCKTITFRDEVPPGEWVKEEG